jgi:hypothetical protein
LPAGGNTTNHRLLNAGHFLMNPDWNSGGHPFFKIFRKPEISLKIKAAIIV